MRSSIAALPPARIRRKQQSRPLNPAAAPGNQPASQRNPRLGIQGRLPTEIVSGTGLTAEEVAFLFWTLEGYDDAKLQASLAAIRLKLGATITFEQLVHVARLASQSMLSCADVTQMCRKLSHKHLGEQVAEMLLSTDDAFRALATRIRLLYLASALHRRQQQHGGQPHVPPPPANRCAPRLDGRVPNNARSTRRQSAVEELRHELDRSKVAQQYFADAINAQAAEVGAYCAVSASQVASKVALQLGLDRLADVVRAVKQRKVGRAFCTWRQITQLRRLEAEARDWARVYAALRLEHALLSWRLRQLQRATQRWSWCKRAQEALEQHAAATELQRRWRGAAVRTWARRLVYNRAATRIQTAARAFVAKRRLRKLRQRQAAAKVVARNWRAFLHRQRAGRAKQRFIDQHEASLAPSQEPHLEVETINAAVAIQLAARRWLARRQLRRLKTAAQIVQLEQERLRAAVRLQAAIRGWLCRCWHRRAQRQRRRQQHQRLDRAAVSIQRWYRRHRHRHRQAQRHQEQQLAIVRTKRAAHAIQRAWRRYREGGSQQPQPETKQQQQQQQLLASEPLSDDDHARIIQRAVRRHLTAQRAGGLVPEASRPQSKLHDLQHEGLVQQVVLIQSVVRMHLARLRISRLTRPVCERQAHEWPELAQQQESCHDEGQSPQQNVLVDEQQHDDDRSWPLQQVVRIQAVWRGWKGRQQAKQAQRCSQVKRRAAAVIGTAMLQYHRRRRRRKEQLISLWSGVALAYCAIRRRLKRQRVRTVRAFLRAWSSEQARERLILTMRERARVAKRKRECAIQIERMARGLLVRIRLRSQRELLVAARQERIAKRRNNAAVLLQCFVRCVFAKRLLRQKRAAAAEAQRRLEEERRLKRTINELYIQHTRSMYALRIQRLYRGFKGRQLYAKLKEEVAERRRDREQIRQRRAAQGIQALWRGYMARKLARKLRQQQLLKRRRRARRKKRSG